MEQISHINNNCNTKATLQGCANGVPYLMVVSDGCCDEAVLKYINLSDGTISNTRPTDFKLGECDNLECPPVFETESFIATAGQTTFTLSNVPYADVVFTRNGATLMDDVATVSGNVVTYVVSENDNNPLLANDHITISYLYKDPNCSASTVSSNICFSFNDGGNVVEVKVVYLNGSIVYYENGVKVTDSARIAQLQGFVANANADNVICCSDCGGGSGSSSIAEGAGINISGNGTPSSPYVVSTDIPPYKTCYKIPEPTSYTRLTYGPYLPSSAGSERFISEIKLQVSNPLSTFHTFDFSADPIKYWDGTNFLKFQDVYDALYAKGYFSKVEELLGCSGLKHMVRVIGNTMFISTYHPDGLCDASITSNFVAEKISNSSGTVVLDADSMSGTQTFVDTFNGTPFEVVFANNVEAYFENGFRVTDPTRLSQLQAIVNTADPNSIICCDCGNQNALQSFQKVIYVDNNNPNSATIFDENNPATVNNDANKQNDNYMYIGADGSVWVWDNATDTYKTYTTQSGTEWNFYNTNTDAGSNKTNLIQRSADIYMNNARFGMAPSGNSGENIVAAVNGLNSVTTGFGNVAAGSNPLRNLTTGNFNVGIGRYAGENLTTGNTNVAIGQLSLRNATTSNDNVTIGANSGGLLTTGNANVFVGPSAGSTQTGGNNNIAIGQNANLPNTTGDNQLSIANSIYGVNIGQGVTTQRFSVGDSSPNSTWDIAGSFGANILSTNSVSYNVTDTDFAIVMNTANSTVNLLAPSTDNLRRILRITNKSTDIVTVSGHINGVASSTFSIPSGGSVDFHSSGNTWWSFTNYSSSAAGLVGSFATMTKNSQSNVTNGTLITWDTIIQNYGTLVTALPGSDTILLRAGYVYEVDVHLMASFANSGSFLNYGLFSGTTAVSQPNAIGTPGKIRPNTDTFANGMFDSDAQAFVVATVDTYVSVKGTGGTASSIDNYENALYFKAKVVGVI